MAEKPTIQKLLTRVNFSDSNRGKGQIKYLVKHYVGATGGAEANCRFFQNTYRGASAHFFVGHNGEIWQCVEENDTAWHCGASSYKHKECRNSNSIGVELCVKKDKNGHWYYTEATKKAAVKLFKYLMEKYNIPVDHVVRHYDVTGKICGEPDVRNAATEWEQFKKDIASTGQSNKKNSTKTDAKKTDAKKADTPKTSAKVDAASDYDKKIAGAYVVATNDAPLRMRKGASTSKDIICGIPKGETVRCYGYHTKEWYLVVYKGNTGYVSSNWLKKK